MCTLFVKDLGTQNASWKKLAIPVENSTNLTPTKGDKLEAKIEGGENEAVKYKKSTYALTFNIRKAKGRKAPFPAKDGVVEHNYAVMLMPEDATTDGFYIESAAVGVDDTFTAADGAIWAATMDALKPTSGCTVKWGTVTVATSNVTFTENADSAAAGGASAVTVTGAFTDNDAVAGE